MLPLQEIAESIVQSVTNTPGVGGLIFAIIFSTAALIYLTAIRWILKGRDDVE